MLTELTQQQIAKFPEYVDKWIKIGLSTEDSINKELAKQSIIKAYKCAGLKEPEIFIFTESPFHNSVLYSIFKNKKVWNSVSDSVSGSISGSVSDSVRDSVGDSVWNSVGNSVWNSVRNSVRDSVRDSVWNSVWDSISDSCYGSHDASWLAFYKYFNAECKIDCSKLEGLWECSKNCGWFIPYQNMVIISPKPKQIITIIDNRGNYILHSDGKPAVYYCDDFQIWALNGTKVPRWLAETPATSLNLEDYKTIDNADVKAEFIKKFGIDRMKSLGQTVDSWENYKKHHNYEWIKKSKYELIDMGVMDKVGYTPYLGMINQTTGTYHLEAVSEDCKTISEAFTNTRWGGRDFDKIKITDIK